MKLKGKCAVLKTQAMGQNVEIHWRNEKYNESLVMNHSNQRFSSLGSTVLIKHQALAFYDLKLKVNKFWPQGAETDSAGVSRVSSKPACFYRKLNNGKQYQSKESAVYESVLNITCPYWQGKDIHVRWESKIEHAAVGVSFFFVFVYPVNTFRFRLSWDAAVALLLFHYFSFWIAYILKSSFLPLQHLWALEWFLAFFVAFSV